MLNVSNSRSKDQILYLSAGKCHVVFWNILSYISNTSLHTLVKVHYLLRVFRLYSYVSTCSIPVTACFTKITTFVLWQCIIIKFISVLFIKVSKFFIIRWTAAFNFYYLVTELSIYLDVSSLRHSAFHSGWLGQGSEVPHRCWVRITDCTFIRGWSWFW